VDEVACYDGIWACASLLHLAAADIPGAPQRLLARRTPPQRPVAPGSEETEPPPRPTPVQAEALAALDGDGPTRDYEALRNTLGRRPTLPGLAFSICGQRSCPISPMQRS